MGAEFSVKDIYVIGGIGAILTGKVKSGHVSEGDVGVTARGKKFSVVKIEKDGSKINRIADGGRVNLTVKHLTREDLRRGENVKF